MSAALQCPIIPPRPILTVTELPNGDLRITADAEAREWIKQERERGQSDEGILWDGFEGYWNNGSYTPFDAGAGNPFVGLTSAPCIAESMNVEDDGTKVIYGKLWWHPNYAVKSFVDELLEHGFVDFTFGGAA